MEEESDKFKNKIDMTYGQFYRALFGMTIDVFCLLEEEVGREDALERLSELSGEKTKVSLRRSLKDEEIDEFDDFIKVYKKQLDSDLFKNTLSYEIKEESDEVFKFDVNRCIRAEIFKEFDAQDIGYEVACQPDFEVLPVFSPNLRLKRTKTLMEGDDCCNFEYTWEE